MEGDTAEEQLRNVEGRFWEWRLRDSPEFASVAGISKYNDRMTKYGLQLTQERHDKVLEFLQEAKAIDPSMLSPVQHIDYDIFIDHLQIYVDGHPWHLYELLNTVNFLEGLTSNPQHFIETMSFNTRGDFENLIERLEKIPAQLSEMIEMQREAIKLNHTQNKVSVEPVPGQIDDLVKSDVTASVFYTPFTDKLEHSHVPLNQRALIRNKAQQAILLAQDAYRHLKRFLVDEYYPATRQTWGISGWDQGKENYKSCLRWHLSLDLTPEEVRDRGLAEVKRIHAEMLTAMGRLGFSGTVAEFFQMIRDNPKFHINSADKLLAMYKDIINQRAFPKMHLLFKDIPTLPLKVEPSPTDGPGGIYLAGTEDGSRPGTFYVNLFHPEGTATIDMVALSLHETVPGHHLQSIYALSTDLPPYRKFQEDDNYYQVPVKFPLYTAYLEGWGLYAEYLGEELGLYADDYELMGRYSSEMFRACRLVVDTGLHYFDWTQEQAIEYMLNHTAYSRTEMTTEINRYMTWPGQACSYKIGEMKIKELRQKAETAMGSHFDVKEFHSILLDNGPVPLHIAERLVDRWIQDNRKP